MHRTLAATVIVAAASCRPTATAVPTPPTPVAGVTLPPDDATASPDDAAQPAAVADRETSLVRYEAGSDRIELLEPVGFSSDDRVEIAPDQPVLDDLAAYLVAHPELVVEIQAHGTREPKYGVRWSDRWAEQVVEVLVARGVAAERLRAVGYGETRPLVPADDPKADETNIRIEVRVLVDRKPL